MFIEVKINGKNRLLNVDHIVEIEPAGDTTNIVMVIGLNAQGYNIECTYSEIKAELSELDLY